MISFIFTGLIITLKTVKKDQLYVQRQTLKNEGKKQGKSTTSFKLVKLFNMDFSIFTQVMLSQKVGNLIPALNILNK